MFRTLAVVAVADKYETFHDKLASKFTNYLRIKVQTYVTARSFGLVVTNAKPETIVYWFIEYLVVMLVAYMSNDSKQTGGKDANKMRHTE
jgi:hypothetical protein